MDLPGMSIQFDCGIEAKNVGILLMALQHHLDVCLDDACKSDVQRAIDGM